MELLELIGFSTALLLLWHQNVCLQWQYAQNMKRRLRRWWVRPINRAKIRHGFQHNLYKELLRTDHEEFYEATRLWPHQFEQLVSLVTPYLRKRSLRRPLSVSTRLAVTLSYLAQGDSVRSKHLEFRIGKSTAHAIIAETCRAIWTALQPQYLPQMNADKWKSVSVGFMDKWQFPNCIGAIDGRHMKIQKPPNTATLYHNYKGFFSMVLLATCDADYKFTWVDIGQYGSLSDACIWNNCALSRDLEAGSVDLPPPTPLPSRTMPFPHVFVGDEGFPLKTYLLRPYSRRKLTGLSDDERIFNYRLSRARRVIENTFGILTARWQILAKPLCCSVQNAENVFKALLCLHNFIKSGQEGLAGCGRRYCPPNFVDNDDDEDGQWRIEGSAQYFKKLGRVGANNAGEVRVGMRNYLKEYFLSPAGESQAPWQYERALVDQM